MTNGEKFEEVFGFPTEGCPVTERICRCMPNHCSDCPFDEWETKEYKECFKLDWSKLNETE